MKNHLFFQIRSIILTLLIVIIAAFVGQYLWRYYTQTPWTRDGRISADVVQVAPDVSGLITAINVHDNQMVKQGQVLFVVDRSRYELALRQAEAVAASQYAALEQAQHEAARNLMVSDLVSKEALDTTNTKIAQDKAALTVAQNAVDVARLNLARTEVRSPVDGYVNDQIPRQGDYVTAGKPALSIVDRHSFHVVGYFEETKLNGVHINQAVIIQIMGEKRLLRGHVQSIAAGIADRERSHDNTLLPNINPTFNWVMVAQRIPVRVALDEVPTDFRLIVGRTATVSVQQKNAS